MEDETRQGNQFRLQMFRTTPKRMRRSGEKRMRLPEVAGSNAKPACVGFFAWSGWNAIGQNVLDIAGSGGIFPASSPGARSGGRIITT